MPVLLLLLAALLQTPRPAPFFTSPYTLAQMKDKQAVVETTAGTFVIALLPEAAPNHVAHFIKTAREHGYDGTTFFRAIKYGLIQGGDPLSKDPARSAQYGVGGLKELRFEPNTEKHTAGAVSAVLLPGVKDSAGWQFFVCASDQPGLDGGYTVFGRVVDGIEVVQQISAMPAVNERLQSRVVMKSVTIRDTPEEPFVNATVDDMAATRVTMETTKGNVVMEMLPALAPETVRQFLRLTAAGVYDDTMIHRVVPGFVIQTGALAYRAMPLTASQTKLVHDLRPEFTDTPNVAGVVSMARGNDINSASTSFFICIGQCRQLDGRYTVFAKVVSGMDVLKVIEGVDRDGEMPKAPLMVNKMSVKR